VTDHHQFDEAVAAYAIGALDADDRAAFETHLATCERCRSELADLRRVGAALAMAAEPVAPPPSLKARTIAFATSQTPRAVSAPAAVPVLTPKRPGLSFVRLAAAAGFIATVGLGLYAWSLQSRVDTLERLVSDVSDRAEQLRDQVAALRLDNIRLIRAADVVEAPDVVRVNLEGTTDGPGARGRAFLSRSRGLVVSAEGLPALSAGRAYQLWMVMPGQQPVSAGMMKVDARGATTFTAPLPAGLTVPANTPVTLALTNEPEAGSPLPTQPIVLAGTVTAG
jgi:anti-sigma-K factor RskA